MHQGFNGRLIDAEAHGLEKTSRFFKSSKSLPKSAQGKKQ
jgi:hypothetical protein